MTGPFELRRSYRFEAAHFLPQVADSHPCSRLHGHSYVVTVVVCGPADEVKGWVVDFATIDECAEPICARLDHRLLNEVEGLGNPTSEMVALWIWEQLKPALDCLRAITVAETADSACTYRGSGADS